MADSLAAAMRRTDTWSASGRETRDRRSSPPTRDSAPKPTIHLSANAGKGKSKEKKTFMDLWVEPSLSAPQASYQDHGGAPYGVLEHMQPLGEIPNAKVKARVKTTATRKPVADRIAAVADLDVQDTPDGSPGAATPRQPSPSEEVTATAPTPAAIIVDDGGDDDDDDFDYTPADPTSRAAKKRRIGRPRGARRKSETAPTSASKAKAPEATPQPQSAEDSEMELDHDASWDPVKLRRVIDSASERFVRVGRPRMKHVLLHLYNQCAAPRPSPQQLRLRYLFPLILSPHSSDALEKEFQGYVREAREVLGYGRRKRSPPRMTLTHPDHAPAASASMTAPPTAAPAAVAASGAAPAGVPDSAEPPTTAESTSLAPSAVQPPPPAQPAKSTRISLKLRPPVKDSASAGTPASVLPTKSPRKRADSGASDSSLTSLTSNEDLSDESLGDTDEEPYNDLFAYPPKRRAHGKKRRPRYGLFNHPPNDATMTDEERAAYALQQKQNLYEAFLEDLRARQQNRVHAKGQATESAIRPSLLEEARRSRTTAAPRGDSSGYDDRKDLTPFSSVSGLDVSQRPPWQPERTSSPKPGKPPRKRAKTKQSPQKKHHAAYGGMTSVGGAAVERNLWDSDDLSELSQNNDFCSGCGGNGYLLCCDGCCRSFHLYCLDPPLGRTSNELEEPWYCPACQSKRQPAARDSPPPKTAQGLFAPLLHSLKKCHPSNFALPEELRERYEGVATDKDGAFMAAVMASKTTRRNGYSEEQPDYYKLRDAKGNLITCYACSRSSAGRRAIVTCDHCSQHWHLDCLDPPLSNPPNLSRDGKKVHDWMCPLHVDRDLRKVDVSLLSPLRRSVHIRKPKQARVVSAAMPRGLRNNGIIEIAEDESDESDSEFYEHDDGGTVYKLPAQGIKLDFIDKVKQFRVQSIRDDRAYMRRALAAAAAAVPRVPPEPGLLDQTNFAKRPFAEKQFALNLAQFARENHDLDLGGSQVENLVGTLIAEAPPALVEQMTLAETELAGNSPARNTSHFTDSTAHAKKFPSGTPAITSAPLASSNTSTNTDTSTTANIAPLSPPSSDQPDQVALSPHQRRELKLLQELIRRKLDGCRT